MNNIKDKSDKTYKRESFIQRNELAFFFVLAYSITWVFNIIGILLIEIYYPFLVLGAFGPFIAAIITVSTTEGKDGLKEFFERFKRKMGFFWLILALLIYGGGLFIGTLIIIIYGVQVNNPYENVSLTIPILNYLVVFGVTTILTGGNEEPGWRGYALPKLLEKYKPIWSALILGIIWAFWHVPSIFLPTLQALIPFHIYFIHIALLSIIFTWLYLKTKGSVLYAIIYHGAINMLIGVLFDFISPTYEQFVLLMSILVLMEAVVAIGLIVIEREQFLNRSRIT